MNDEMNIGEVITPAPGRNLTKRGKSSCKTSNPLQVSSMKPTTIPERFRKSPKQLRCGFGEMFASEGSFLLRFGSLPSSNLQHQDVGSNWRFLIPKFCSQDVCNFVSGITSSHRVVENATSLCTD